jgi:hypothetical protein
MKRNLERTRLLRPHLKSLSATTMLRVTSEHEVYDPPRNTNWDAPIPAHQQEVVLPLRFPSSCSGLFPHWILRPFIRRGSAPCPRACCIHCWATDPRLQPPFRTVRIPSLIQSIRACTTNRRSFTRYYQCQG